MSNPRELGFRLAVLFGVASAASAIAAALGEAHPLRLAGVVAGALATLAYLGWAAALRAGGARTAAERGLALPLAVALGGWALASEDPAVGAAFALPALACGILAAPASAAAQATACIALLAAVAFRATEPERWLVPVGIAAAAGAGGVLLSLARGARQPRRLGAALFRALPLGAFFVEEGRVVAANDAAARMMGREVEALAGLPLLHLVAPDDRERVEALLDAPHRESLPIRARRVDGTLFEATVSIASIEAARVVLLADRSDSARVERAKDEFVSMVSHELRTPLTAIHGALGLIEGGAAGEVSEKAQQLVALGKRNTERLVRLVTDILDLKRLESGRLVLKHQALEPRSPVGNAIEGIAVLAEDAGVTLETDIGETPKVWADPDRIVQVLTNLLSNAIKFTPEGSTVRVGIVSAGDAVRFTVVDDGPGVPEGERERLFSRFQQLDQSDTRQVGGSGLGLAIARAIVLQHGGKIGVEAGGEGGSCFYFELPAHEP